MNEKIGIVEFVSDYGFKFKNENSWFNFCDEKKLASWTKSNLEVLKGHELKLELNDKNKIVGFVDMRVVDNIINKKDYGKGARLGMAFKMAIDLNVDNIINNKDEYKEKVKKIYDFLEELEREL